MFQQEVERCPCTSNCDISVLFLQTGCIKYQFIRVCSLHHRNSTVPLQHKCHRQLTNDSGCGAMQPRLWTLKQTSFNFHVSQNIQFCSGTEYPLAEDQLSWFQKEPVSSNLPKEGGYQQSFPAGIPTHHINDPDSTKAICVQWWLPYLGSNQRHSSWP